jgi:hypothetical protein
VGDVGRVWIAIAVTVAALAMVVPAHAADPGRWVLTGKSTMPLYYYQGVTSDPSGNLFFNGIHIGLYRTDAELHETGRADDVIPPDVHARENYNHIGDISFDAAEGGRILLPLECYYPPAGNTCKTGSIGVADPATLKWRYYVKLDSRDLTKVMWNEVTPDGKLFWTSGGPDFEDLLAYRISDITQANAAPAGPKPRPVKVLKGAVPPSGITGGTFYEGRLYVAGENAPQQFQVWSIDLTTGKSRLEIERTVVGESEGLDVFDSLGGVLHWQIQPYNTKGPPTYGIANGTLLHFVPAKRGIAGRPGSKSCIDGAAPSSRFARREPVAATRRGIRLRGTARDRGCRTRGTSVKRVLVAIMKRQGRGRCRHLQPSRRFSGTRSCRRPTYLRARGRTSWSYVVKRRLPPGTYTARSRGLDVAGNVERKRRRSGRSRNFLTFRVRR